jgi:hypothetical protein
MRRDTAGEAREPRALLADIRRWKALRALLHDP